MEDPEDPGEATGRQGPQKGWRFWALALLKYGVAAAIVTAAANFAYTLSVENNRPPDAPDPDEGVRLPDRAFSLDIQQPPEGHVATSDTDFVGRINTRDPAGSWRATWRVDDGEPSRLTLVGDSWNVKWTAHGSARVVRFHVVVEDEFGTKAEATRAFRFEPPPLRILVDEPAPDTVATGDVVFRGRLEANPATQGPVRAWWWMDDGTPSPLPLQGASWEVPWTAWGPGQSHVFHVLAEDRYNTTAQANLSFTLQPPPLVVAIDTPSPGHVASGDTRFMGRVEAPLRDLQDVSAIWWMDDGTPSDLPLENGTWRIVWTAWGPTRTHVFHVRVQDDAGASAEAAFEFEYRLPPLDLRIDAPQAGHVAYGDTTFSGRVNATPEYLRGTTVVWWMDDGTPSPPLTLTGGDWSLRWTAWGESRNLVFHVRATDEQGRVAEAQLPFRYETSGY